MRGLQLVAVGIWFSIVGAAANAGTLAVPDGYVYEQIVGGPWTTAPIAFTWLPDGRIITIQQDSGIVGVVPTNAASSTPFLTMPDVVNTGFEQGLLGVACDPDWPSRPYLYFYYNHSGDVCYLTMYTMSGDLTDPLSSALTASSPYHILTDVPDAQELHQSGTLRFGPDDMLYVSQGEDGDACSAQEIGTLGGKILRLDVSSMPGAGSGPPAKADITPSGNPFAGPDDNSRLVWAWGLRNPFRFTVDDLTGDLYVGDVGASAWEEIDHIPFASGGGQNFGWPQREGPDPFPCACGTCGSGNLFTAPAFTYPHVLGPHSVVPGPIFRSVPDSVNSLSPSLDGSLFFAEFYDGLRRLVLDGGSWVMAPPLPGQPSATNFAEGVSFISDIQLGPDGALYLLNISGGRGIYRIRAGVPVSAPEIGGASGSWTLSAQPNPIMDTGTTIRWANAAPGIVSVRILDASGRQVRDLGAVRSTGSGQLHWDGMDDHATAVAAGVYFYRVSVSDTDVRAGKVVRIR